ncbi:unnamed protein product [Hapterophycus canaliculatus]
MCFILSEDCWRRTKASCHGPLPRPCFLDEFRSRPLSFCFDMCLSTFLCSHSVLEALQPLPRVLICCSSENWFVFARKSCCSCCCCCVVVSVSEAEMNSGEGALSCLSE